ncbi:protein of unknown function [Methylocella tundrae]|uniref:Uncharacterized protein n=1 Tax=Methylocella tundrae TaxID=227605 RepID=A0A4U8YZ23_METTU|nr:protein of unknown function [Methylocella tundrae]
MDGERTAPLNAKPRAAVAKNLFIAVLFLFSLDNTTRNIILLIRLAGIDREQFVDVEMGRALGCALRVCTC